MTRTDPVTGRLASIAYDDVWLSFADTHVLRGLDLLVPSGSITVLVGGSGAGKSVTFKLALGLLEPTAGSVWVDGENLADLRERQRARIRSAFGVVFQHGALFDSMSVFDNVAFPLREFGETSASEIADRVSLLLGQVGLAGTEQKLPAQLSGGMQKRVGLARALAREPRFLFYDEPTSGLDPILSAAMHQLIVDTQAAHPHLTSFVISHDLEGALGIADKIALLKDGQIAHTAAPDRFVDIDDPYLQGFLHPTPPHREVAS